MTMTLPAVTIKDVTPPGALVKDVSPKSSLPDKCQLSSKVGGTLLPLPSEFKDKSLQNHYQELQKRTEQVWAKAKEEIAKRSPNADHLEINFSQLGIRYQDATGVHTIGQQEMTPDLRKVMGDVRDTAQAVFKFCRTSEFENGCNRSLTSRAPQFHIPHQKWQEKKSHTSGEFLEGNFDIVANTLKLDSDARRKAFADMVATQQFLQTFRSQVRESMGKLEQALAKLNDPATPPSKKSRADRKDLQEKLGKLQQLDAMLQGTNLDPLYCAVGAWSNTDIEKADLQKREEKADQTAYAMQNLLQKQLGKTATELGHDITACSQEAGDLSYFDLHDLSERLDVEGRPLKGASPEAFTLHMMQHLQGVSQIQDCLFAQEILRAASSELPKVLSPSNPSLTNQEKIDKYGEILKQIDRARDRAHLGALQPIDLQTLNQHLDKNEADFNVACQSIETDIAKRITDLQNNVTQMIDINRTATVNARCQKALHTLGISFPKDLENYLTLAIRYAQSKAEKTKTELLTRGPSGLPKTGTAKDWIQSLKDKKNPTHETYETLLG